MVALLHELLVSDDPLLAEHRKVDDGAGEGTCEGSLCQTRRNTAVPESLDDPSLAGLQVVVCVIVISDAGEIEQLPTEVDEYESLSELNKSKVNMSKKSTYT